MLRLTIAFGLATICATSSAQIRLFEHIEPVWADPARESSFYAWKQIDRSYVLHGNGTLRSAVAPGRAALTLPMPKQWQVARLAVADYGGDLLLAYQATSGGDVESHLCRVKRDLTARRWCQTANTFNLEAGLGHDTIVISGIGFVGRIDPANGKYFWKHDWLYGSFTGASQDSFVVVCPASDEHWYDFVTFRSKGHNAGTGKLIRLRRDGGAVVGVEAAPDFQTCLEAVEEVK